MRKINLFLIILVITIISCNNNNVVDNKAKEQQIRDSIEKVIRDSLEKIIRDTIKKETVVVQKLKMEDLVGNWEVKMKCNSSDCYNAKDGDIRTEQWFINIESNKVKVNVVGSTTSIASYTGEYDEENETLELKYQVSSAKVKVSLKVTNIKKMQGQRIVSNSVPCTIIYNLTLTKN